MARACNPVRSAINAILRRGAEDHHKREIRRPELYKALTFLDQFLERKNWLSVATGMRSGATRGTSVRRWSSGKNSGFGFAASSRLALSRVGSSRSCAVPSGSNSLFRNTQGLEMRMADENKSDRVTLEELMVSTLAMTDALAKLLIGKGVITDAEFKSQLSTDRANTSPS
jgi:hypothetical protein